MWSRCCCSSDLADSQLVQVSPAKLLLGRIWKLVMMMAAAFSVWFASLKTFQPIARKTDTTSVQCLTDWQTACLPDWIVLPKKKFASKVNKRRQNWLRHATTYTASINRHFQGGGGNPIFMPICLLFFTRLVKIPDLSISPAAKRRRA